MITDRAELMYARQTAEDDPVSYVNMATQRSAVRKDDVVAHHAIVRDVRICHEHAVASYDCSPRLSSSAVQRNEFPNICSVADFERCRFSTVFQVLRRPADGSHIVNPAIPSNAGAILNVGMRSDLGSFTNGDGIFNDRERPHAHAIPDLGLWTYHGARINVRSHYFFGAFWLADESW
jgi:hypothetical protein